MPPIFRSSSSVVCFFCNTVATSGPSNPRQFRCTNCGCWNRFDSAGQISSDEPAMHDETLNKRSFARRAVLSKDRLPTIYGKGPFCHNCQTNQMLLVNLLSNYLPPLESPEYDQRLAALPEYQKSLYHRYPPVCDTCLPNVEEELRKKNEMARTKALGGWLLESKSKNKQRKMADARKEVEKLGAELIIWRFRGGLWVLSVVSAILGNAAFSFGYSIYDRFSFLYSALPALAILSILWTAWDPTYHTVRKAKLEGRALRISGRKQFIGWQVFAWASRLFTSIFLALSWFRPHLDFLQLSQPQSMRRRVYFSCSLFLELLCLIVSLTILEVQRPAPIRLIDTSTHLRPPPPSPVSKNGTPMQTVEPGQNRISAPSAPDLISSLSLSSKPVVTSPAANPIFGVPSLPSPPPPASTDDKMDEDQSRDADAMDVDWSPKSSKVVSKFGTYSTTDDGSWLRPQRFFAPEHPTGLESLLAKTGLTEEGASRGVSGRSRALRWNWGLVYVGSLIPLLGIAYKAWGWRSKEVAATTNAP